MKKVKKCCHSLQNHQYHTLFNQKQPSHRQVRGLFHGRHGYPENNISALKLTHPKSVMTKTV